MVETPGTALKVVLKVPFGSVGEEVEIVVGTVDLAKMERRIRRLRRSNEITQIYVLGLVPGTHVVMDDMV